MARTNVKAREWTYALSELRYYAALGGLVLMAPLSLTALLWLLPAVTPSTTGMWMAPTVCCISAGR